MLGMGLALQAQWAAGSVHAEQWARLPGAHTYTCLVQSGVPSRVVRLESGLRLGAAMMACGSRSSNSDGRSCRSGGEVIQHLGESSGFEAQKSTYLYFLRAGPCNICTHIYLLAEHLNRSFCT